MTLSIQQPISTRLDNVINCKASREPLCQTCTLLLHTPCIQIHFITQGRVCRQLKRNDSPATYLEDWSVQIYCSTIIVGQGAFLVRDKQNSLNTDTIFKREEWKFRFSSIFQVFKFYHFICCNNNSDHLRNPARLITVPSPVKPSSPTRCIEGLQ